MCGATSEQKCRGRMYGEYLRRQAKKAEPKDIADELLKHMQSVDQRCVP